MPRNEAKHAEQEFTKQGLYETASLRELTPLEKLEKEMCYLRDEIMRKDEKIGDLKSELLDLYREVLKFRG